LKLEKDTIIRNKNFSLFKSKFKNKIIKLISNFAEATAEYIFKNVNQDPYNYYFYKKLLVRIIMLIYI